MAFAHAFGLLAAQDDEQALELVAALFAATCMTVKEEDASPREEQGVAWCVYFAEVENTLNPATAGLAACNLLRDSQTSRGRSSHRSLTASSAAS